MNLKKSNKKQVKDAAEKFWISDLLEKGVRSADILKELCQYLNHDVQHDFVEHFMKMYDITDASDVEFEVASTISKEEIERFANDLDLFLIEKNLPDADLVLAIEDVLKEKELQNLIENVKEDLNISGDYISLHTMARKYGWDKIYKSAKKFIPDVVKQAVASMLLAQNLIQDAADNIEDPGNLNERAELVERYTENIALLEEDNKVLSEEIINKVDELFPDQVKELSDKISERFNQAESLDSTVSDYVKNQGLDPLEVVKFLNETLKEEDKLVLVDSLIP